MRATLCFAALIVLTITDPGHADCPDFEVEPSTLPEFVSLTDTIRVNQIGYLPDGPKIAYIVDQGKPLGLTTPTTQWALVNADTGQIMLCDIAASRSYLDYNSEDIVTRLDFSTVTTPGRYFLVHPLMGRSYPFEISRTVFHELLRSTARSYYYQRCGTAIEEPYAEGFPRNACHGGDGYDLDSVYIDSWGTPHLIAGPYLELTGGWHDAGDYGKKVTPASVGLFYLLKLAELFPGKAAALDLNLPPDPAGGDAPLPDLLKEIKYELDFFFKMQLEDGSVYHVVTSPGFSPFMPDADFETRFALGPTSVATADFAGIMALASVVFEPYDPAYASHCLSAARDAFDFLELHPGFVPAGGWSDPPGVIAGGYPDTKDSDERLFAAAELFNATDEAYFRAYFESYVVNESFGYPAAWVEMAPFAFFTYAFKVRHEPVNRIRDDIKIKIKDYADNTVTRMARTGYHSPLTPSTHYWGSNGVVLSFGVDLVFAHLLYPESAYEAAALDTLNYLLGANALNLSFVTGLGEHSVHNLHHRPSILDVYHPPYPSDPIPGFIPGGPNASPDVQDAALNLVVNTGAPPAKCYVDDDTAYSCNEPSVDIMARAVFLAAYFTPLP